MTTASVAVAVAVLAMAAIAALAAARARRAEAALRESVNAYGALVARGSASDVATRALEERTRHAQLLEDVGRTADELAHDLKDLLTAITGRTELLIASLDDAHPGLADAYEIRRLALSAARMSKPLRALSGSRTATDLIDVNLVASRTAEAFGEMLGGDIDVSLTLDPGVTRVRAGAGHLEEIVLTLAMRARSAMPRGGRLTLSTARRTHEQPDSGAEAAREYVRLVLTHTGGTGVDVDRAALAGSAAGADAGAVGLGKIVDVVKQAGGSIAVEPAPGIGTSFVVDLPAATGALASETPVAARTFAASVLVVEDEPRVRDLIKTVLSREGHDVVAVAGPHDGLAVLKRHPGMELMLVDVVMPDMNGYDLAIQARAIVPGLRVVFMSGFAQDESRHPTGDRFLPKPFAIESLNAAVQQALSAH